MKFLLIEDDHNKAKNLMIELQAIVPDVELVLCRSSQSGMYSALSEQYDLLLLDMSLPQYDIGPTEDGYEFNFFAGREILFELVRKDVRLPTVVITQFETFGEASEMTTLQELDKQLQSEFSGLYLGAIYYSASRSDWRRELGLLILQRYG